MYRLIVTERGQRKVLDNAFTSVILAENMAQKFLESAGLQTQVEIVRLVITITKNENGISKYHT